MKNVVLTHKPAVEVLTSQLSPDDLIGIEMDSHQKAFVQRDIWEGRTYTIVCSRGLHLRNNYLAGVDWNRIVEVLTNYIKTNGYSVMVFANENEMFAWLAK